MENLNTGDIILFNSHEGGIWNIFSNLIRWGTNSKYTHVAMILKDPTFIHSSLKGLYIWESGWENLKGDTKLGVQITPLRDVLELYKKTGGECFYRKLDCDRSCFSEENLKKLYENVSNKMYDLCPLDWIEAYFRIDLNPQKTDRFWCSAFVGYIYTYLGILEKDLDWSILRPSDFSLEYDNQFLYFNKGYKLLDEQNPL